MNQLGKLYQLDYNSEKNDLIKNNKEIQWRWITLGLKNEYKGVVEQALNLVQDQGRMKFTVTTYKNLSKWINNDIHKQTKNVFLKVKDTYHPICTKMVEQLLIKQKILP